MDEYSIMIRWLEKERKRLKQRRLEKNLTIQESASIDGSILTINKVCEFLSNKLRDENEKKTKKLGIGVIGRGG